MHQYDIIVVGAGPGGATCARRLAQANKRVLLLDRESFPRDKLCAGWITPDVVDRVGMTRDNYQDRWLTFKDLQFYFPFKRKPIATAGPQHSIRRVEFDAHLVQLATEAGAAFKQHNVRKVLKVDDGFQVDDVASAPILVGAGGTRCPIHRTLFDGKDVRQETKQVAALEQEFAYDYKDASCHLWFFDGGLPGYAWYVPKENGYLNCGLGGLAHLFKEGEGIKAHWVRFVATMQSLGLLDASVELKPKGYSYYLRSQDVIRSGNAFLVGDAAGLATCDLGEGIGAAIQSGELAAASIVDGQTYELPKVPTYTSNRLIGGLISLGMRHSGIWAKAAS